MAQPMLEGRGLKSHEPQCYDCIYYLDLNHQTEAVIYNPQIIENQKRNQDNMSPQGDLLPVFSMGGEITPTSIRFTTPQLPIDFRPTLRLCIKQVGLKSGGKVDTQVWRMAKHHGLFQNMMSQL